VCAEMDEQWGYVGAKSRQRWLFYAYDRLRKTVVAHVLGSALSGTKTHVKQRFLPLTPLLMVSDVLWSPVLPA
ncbi:IS1 family transposase, partial [Escherichia coli]